MKKRKTIGDNPLDRIIPDQTETKESKKSRERQRMTIHLPVDLTDRLRNAVYWTPGETIGKIAERALSRELSRLERANGGPFPERESELTGGRGVS